MNIAEVVKGVEIFQGLDDESMDLLLTKGQIKNYPRNTIFINEGDTSGNMFIVLEGRAKVFLSDEEGKEFILGFEKSGGYIGEIALLDSEPRTASVKTTEKSRVLMFSRDSFQSLVLSNQKFAVGMIHGLTKRMRGLISNAGSLGLKNVYRRLVGTLLDMSEPQGDVKVVSNRLTHQDIADMIGASREMVSRILKDLSTGGYITTKDRQLHILKTPPSGW